MSIHPANSAFFHVCAAHLLPGWLIVTSGLQALDPLLTAGSFSPQHMRKMCALYMIVSTTSDTNALSFFQNNLSVLFHLLE